MFREQPGYEMGQALLNYAGMWNLRVSHMLAYHFATSKAWDLLQ